MRNGVKAHGTEHAKYVWAAPEAERGTQKVHMVCTQRLLCPSTSPYLTQLCDSTRVGQLATSYASYRHQVHAPLCHCSHIVRYKLCVNARSQPKRYNRADPLRKHESTRTSKHARSLKRLLTDVNIFTIVAECGGQTDRVWRTHRQCVAGAGVADKQSYENPNKVQPDRQIRDMFMGK